MNKDENMHKAIQYFQTGNLLQAEQIFKQLEKKQPDNAEAVHYLGLIAHQKGDYEAAISYTKKEITLRPKDANTYTRLGFLLKKKGLLNEAIEYFRKAIQYNPNLIDAHYNLGNTLKATRKYDEAIECYKTVLRLNPQDYEAWNNLGNVFKEQGQLDEAIESYEKSVEINPDFAFAYNNLGAVLQEKGLMEDAYQCYQKALEINPTFISAMNNMGIALRSAGRTEEAITYYKKAIEIEPADAEAYWNLGITLLLTGNFEKGWELYEWRLRKKDVSVVERSFSQSRWDGSNIEGRTILLYAEQGVGDTIQFVRFASLLAERRARVIVECQKELVELIQSVQGVDLVIEKGKQLPTFDTWCPLLSLPLHFGIALENIPAKTPYLDVPKEKKDIWHEKFLKDPSGFRVGLVWAGNPAYRHDRVRSCSLELFKKLGEIDGLVLYSLQKGSSEQNNKDVIEAVRLIDYMQDMRDFSDTASFIENLDLVISVDTAVAHLAGSLGKKVWTLLPHAPDWRWMLKREDSPWYPTMKLFRQPSYGEWYAVIDDVFTELKKIISDTKWKSATHSEYV